MTKSNFGKNEILSAEGAHEQKRRTHNSACENIESVSQPKQSTLLIINCKDFSTAKHISPFFLYNYMPKIEDLVMPD